MLPAVIVLNIFNNVLETDGWNGETLIICQVLLCKVVSDAMLFLVVMHLYMLYMLIDGSISRVSSK